MKVQSRKWELLSAICWVTMICACGESPRSLPHDWPTAAPKPRQTKPLCPTSTSPLITPTPTLETHPTPSTLPSQPLSPSDPPDTLPSKFITGEQTEIGIQINGCDHDPAQSIPLVKSLGFTWIKQQVRWADVEVGPEQFDWRCLDRVMAQARKHEIKVLLSVTTAPAHTRQIYRGIFHPTNGRPADLRDFGVFMARLIERYPKQIHAIEMWNEPNLIREWGDTLDGVVYTQLLAIGYGVVKHLDPSIMVISAGLAPTSFNTLWTHVDDIGFVQQMLGYQALSYTNCFGAHANGPDGVGEIDLVAQRYFKLLNRRAPICLTEFGFAVPIQNQAPEGFAWIMSHIEAMRTQKLVDGLHWARRSGYVRLVIVWNLDYNGPWNDPNAPYALLYSPALNMLTTR